MDAKLVYWTAALANLAIVVACAALGIAAIRRGDVPRHRRRMLTAAALIGVFLFSYMLKVFALGKEDRTVWTTVDHLVLYVHETCIAVMLIAGGVALYRAWSFRRALGPDGAIPVDPASAPARASHRRAGTVAKWSGLLAFVTACGVWLGMWLRA